MYKYVFHYREISQALLHILVHGMNIGAAGSEVLNNRLNSLHLRRRLTLRKEYDHQLCKVFLILLLGRRALILLFFLLRESHLFKI